MDHTTKENYLLPSPVDVSFLEPPSSFFHPFSLSLSLSLSLFLLLSPSYLELLHRQILPTFELVLSSGRKILRDKSAPGTLSPQIRMKNQSTMAHGPLELARLASLWTSICFMFARRRQPATGISRDYVFLKFYEFCIFLMHGRIYIVVDHSSRKLRDGYDTIDEQFSPHYFLFGNSNFGEITSNSRRVSHVLNLWLSINVVANFAESLMKG